MHEIRTSIISGQAQSMGPVARRGRPKAAGAGLGGLSEIAIKREEARVTNWRSEDRHYNIVEERPIYFRRRKQDVRIVNVSSRGAMIECAIEARIGETIEILFVDTNRTACIVRWVREGRIGVEFVNETILWNYGEVRPVSRDDAEARTGDAPAARPVADRAPRHNIIRGGNLYWSGITIPVRLRNISPNGAQIEGDLVLVHGSEVELDLGEAGFQAAEVRWSKDGQVGLRFASDFDLGALAPARHGEADGTEMLRPAYLETELRPDSPWAARYERLTLTDLKSAK